VTTTVGEGVDLPIDVLQSPTNDLCEEHEVLAQGIDQLAIVAEAIAVRPFGQLGPDIERVLRFVAGPILRHIQTEYDLHAHLAFRDCRPVPSRAEVEEIERQAGRLADLGAAGDGSGAEGPHALRAALFELHTLLHLHFASGC
jgi:hypothetical protein